MSKIFENWRKFINEQKLASFPEDEEIESLPIPNASDPGPLEDPEQENEMPYVDPGIDKVSGVPNMLKRAPKHSMVIGNPKGKGTKSDPRGIFINGEFLGEDERWILGKNSDNFYKFKNYKKTDEPNPTYRQTHYGTTELVSVIKSAIARVNSISDDIYAAQFAKMLLGKTESKITREDMEYGKVLMGLGFYPKKTQKLYIEDLGLAPFFVDRYGNTYHGGQSVIGHGSHRTGQDADLGFYMLPGHEMTTMFPKNKVPFSKMPRAAADEAEMIRRRIGTEGNPLFGTKIHVGAMAPSREKISVKGKPPAILPKRALDALSDAYDPNSEDGYSEDYKANRGFPGLKAGVEKITRYLSSQKITVRNTFVKNRETGGLYGTQRAFLSTNVGTMDMERTWMLIDGLLDTGMVTKILIDRELHLGLKQACKRAGGKWSRKIIHWPLHKNHIHINVKTAKSVELGKKLAPQISKSWQKWDSIKRVVKRKSEESPNWVEEFYNEKGFDSYSIYGSKIFDSYTMGDWAWNRKMGLSGAYEQLMKIIDPTTYADIINKLGKLPDEAAKINKELERAKDLVGDDIQKEAKDPKVGTGKKPKGSSRRLYTDENPKDTVSVKFSSVSDIRDTFRKKSFKSKSHKRQSQIINLVHQRVRAAYKNAKDPKVKSRLKKAFEYAKKRKEASKKKTIARNKNK